MLQHEVHSAIELRLGNAPVGRQAHPTGAGVDDHPVGVQRRLHLFGVVRRQRDDAASLQALARREDVDAGVVAAVDDDVGQLTQPPLDVVDAHLEDQLEPGERSVVRGNRPRPGLQPPGVGGPVEPLQRERERVLCGKPARTLRLRSRQQLGAHVHERRARAAAQPLQASADEGVAAELMHVDGHAADRLVAVDDAQRAGGVRGVGDRPDVLQVAGRIEEVGRDDHRRLVVDAFGEGSRRDGRPVLAGHELDLEVGPGEPLVPDGREVEGADQHLPPARCHRQARRQRGQRRRNRRRDRRRARRGVQQLGHPGAQPLQHREPVRIPGGRALGVPGLGVAVQGGPAGAGKGPQGAGVEVDPALQEREFGSQPSPVPHDHLRDIFGRFRPGRSLAALSRPTNGRGRCILAVRARPAAHLAYFLSAPFFKESRMISEMRAPSRLSYGRIPNLVELKDLIATQLESFHWFKSEGLRELFDEINPITDYTGKNFELKFLDYEFGQPKFSVEECRNRDMTYAAPLRIKTRLTIKETGEIKESEVYMGDFAMMTEEGTFIVNGTERVVVSQLVRSPGVYFTAAEDPNTGRKLFGAKLIPNRGAWLEIETSAKDLLTVKIDRKRKVPVTVLLKALELPQLKGTENDREAQKRALLELFGDVDDNPEHRYMESTLDKDTTNKTEDALLELYRRVRPGDPPSVDNARNLLQSLFFNPRRFDLGRVGRYKVDKRLGRDEEDILDRVKKRELRILEKGDFIAILRKLIELNNASRERQIPDDIDHLGNRRVRAVGELLQNQFRMGLIRMERIIKERMTISDPHTVTSASLINARPVVAAIKEFFGSSQLSQFMDQHNPLSELTHKRRLSALGPGGLSRERAGFDVRDVHHSHYGRICPIETPEGPNIGLIGNLATYAKVNEFGFVESPFRRVYNRMSVGNGDAAKLTGRKLRRPAVDAKGNEVLPAGHVLDEKEVQKLAKAHVASVDIVPWVSDEVEYLSADEEDMFGIAQANAALTPDSTFTDARVPARTRSHYGLEDVGNIQYMDVSPKQIVSVATAMIPFLEHDDAGRALMGANMQRQAVPLLVTDAPLVGTGVE